MKNGRLITVEGIEGAGKSTHIESICEALRAREINVVATREPGGTPVGEKLRDLLLSDRCGKITAEAELLLMFAARAEHIATVVRPALAAGTWVVSDRFTDASYAYQGGGRGCSRELLDALSDAVCGDIRPDLTFLLDLKPEEAGERVVARGAAKDRFETESGEFFSRVRDAYLALAAADPARWRVIPAQHEMAQVKTLIIQALETLLEDSI